jgi:hypothetical protein
MPVKYHRFPVIFHGKLLYITAIGYAPSCVILFFLPKFCVVKGSKSKNINAPCPFVKKKVVFCQKVGFLVLLGLSGTFIACQTP